MKRIVLVLMLSIVPLAAQELKKDDPAKAPPEPYQQKVFILKYADPENLRILLSVFGGGIIPNFEMHALAITAPPVTMQAIEDAIARLDVPAAAPKNFDFTVDLVVGSNADNQPSGSVPKDLDSVVAQLKNTFPFRNYRLLDILTLRTRAGKPARTESAGGVEHVQSAAVPPVAVPETVTSDFRIASASLGADGTTAHLDGVRCTVGFRRPLSLQSDLDIKEGQKVVIGRMGMNEQQALFVVLTVKVVQ